MIDPARFEEEEPGLFDSGKSAIARRGNQVSPVTDLLHLQTSAPLIHTASNRNMSDMKMDEEESIKEPVKRRTSAQATAFSTKLRRKSGTIDEHRDELKFQRLVAMNKEVKLARSRLQSMSGGDIILQFFLSYQSTDFYDRGQWVTEPHRIRHHYLRTWFPWDVLSTIPYDLFSFSEDTSEAKNLKIMRIVRILRLLKMARLVRASTTLSRLQNQYQIRYTTISLVKNLLMVAFATHWIACIWWMTVTYQIDRADGADPMLQPTTWYSEYNTAGCKEPGKTECLDPNHDVGKLYVICLYWAVTTLSTIGYGDAANPTNRNERLVAIVCMCLGSTVWAAVLGSVCNIITTRDEEANLFAAKMEHINHLSETGSFDIKLHYELTEYFRIRRHMDVNAHSKYLISEMSPKLQSRVSLAMHSNWIEVVTWLKAAAKSEPSFISGIAMAIESSVYTPQESVPANTLHILLKGVVIKDLTVVISGDRSCWGQDFLLQSEHLKKTKAAVCLTYVSVAHLTKPSWEQLITEFPSVGKIVRTSVMWLAVRRTIVKLVKDLATVAEFAKKYNGPNWLGELIDFKEVVRGKIRVPVLAKALSQKCKLDQMGAFVVLTSFSSFPEKQNKETGKVVESSEEVRKAGDAWTDLRDFAKYFDTLHSAQIAKTLSNDSFVASFTAKSNSAMKHSLNKLNVMNNLSGSGHTKKPAQAIADMHKDLHEQMQTTRHINESNRKMLQAFTKLTEMMNVIRTDVAGLRADVNQLKQDNAM